MGSPTSRTLAAFKKEGWRCQVVERWIPYTKTRKDLFGCIDIVAIRKNEIMGIQATSTGNMNSRIDKSMALEELKDWLKAGGQFCVIGWAKRGKKGKVKHWTMKRVDITLKDLLLGIRPC